MEMIWFVNLRICKHLAQERILFIDARKEERDALESD